MIEALYEILGYEYEEKDTKAYQYATHIRVKAKNEREAISKAKKLQKKPKYVIVKATEWKTLVQLHLKEGEIS